MQTIGIIGAMEEEVAALRQKGEQITAKSIGTMDFYLLNFEGKQLVVVQSGIGKVNAAICAQILVDHFGVDCVINVGVAGGLKKGLHIGDVVISKSVQQWDVDVSALGDPAGTIPRMETSIFPADDKLVDLAQQAGTVLEGKQVFVGHILSGDQFVASNDVKERLKTVFHGDCVEMEGAAIGHACFINKMPFVIIRSISDSADDDGSMSYETFKSIAIENSMALLEKMIANIE